MLAHLLAGRFELCLLQQQHWVAAAGLFLPVRQGLDCTCQLATGGRQRLEPVSRQAAEVGQLLARELELVAGGDQLRLQAARPGGGLVGVGDGGISDGETVPGLDQRPFNRGVLLLQQGQPALGQHQIEIALGELQHPVLPALPVFELGRVGGDAELAALRAARGIQERLLDAQGPAGRVAAVDRGREIDPGALAEAGGRELRPLHPAVRAGSAGSGRQADGRAPERGRLLAPGRAGCTPGLEHRGLRIMLAGSLPDLQQVGGAGVQGQRQDGRGEQAWAHHLHVPWRLDSCHRCALSQTARSYSRRYAM